MVFNNAESNEEITYVLVIALFILVVQLLLCFKAENFSFKLVPIFLFIVSGIISFVLSFCIDDWFIFYTLRANTFLASAGLLISGLGWLIWAIVRKLKK